MIVRILGEGQFEVADDRRGVLEELDARLDGAVESGDDTAFVAALDAVIAEIRTHGVLLPSHALTASDLVVPFPDATVSEARGLLEPETTDES